MGDDLVIQWKAFPLRPEPNPSVAFKGTYREEGWRRCGAMAASDGITYTPWPRDDYPNWSLPALEAAKCVALQGDPLFEALHLRLYAAFFAEGVNIGVREEVASVVRDLPGLDVDRFVADYQAGKGRAAVLEDYDAALSEHGVRAIPTVVLGGGRRIVGAVSLAEYRRALAP